MNTKFHFIEIIEDDFEPKDDCDVTNQLNDELNFLNQNYTNVKILNIKMSTCTKPKAKYKEYLDTIVSILIYFQYSKEKEE